MTDEEKPEEKSILLRVPITRYQPIDDYCWRERVRNRTEFYIQAIEEAIKKKPKKTK